MYCTLDNNKIAIWLFNEMNNKLVNKNYYYLYNTCHFNFMLTVIKVLGRADAFVDVSSSCNHVKY